MFERSAAGPSFTVMNGSRLVLRGVTLHRNNLIANNFRGNEFDASAQKGGTCTFTGSKVLASDSTAHFVSPIAEPFDYHLADAQSEAVNVGILSNSPITEDFDGDARSDGMPDVGADELHP